ncbi:39S ribosomal protein L10, mitochondrial [Nematostella vectensis]|uniref:39S ribosomal protein L10, mitochondrial n=1 Tax=Nematostella vectensis TaxID=45351 RepID=UPI0013900956|nr:39S ribosomal protein L10, mitochondrial [Nematostella vectensis]
MAARAVGLTSNKGLTFFVRAFNDCALRSASSMAAVRQPRKMAARCRAGKNKLRQAKPSQKKLEIVSNVREVFGNSCVTVFQYGDMNTAEWEDLRYALSKHNVKVKIFPNRVTHKALEDTIYDGIIPLFACTTCVIYSEEPAVKPILDVIKRQPKLELLGAKIDNRLMSVRNVQDFAKLPSLTELHVTLVQLLQHQSNQLGSLLQQNQSQLSSNLDQLVKQGGEQQ